MKRNLLLAALVLLSRSVHATNYFIDGINGNNANNGMSTATAFRTIQTAVPLTNAGDTVFIMDGTYTSTGNIININRSGSAAAQIVYTNYPGSLPKLQAQITTYTVIGITPGTSYITINGLEIIGYGTSLSLAADTTPAKMQVNCPVAGNPATSTTALQKYNGNGITGDSRTVTVGSHHIVISNNKVHDCTSAGIGFLNCDYVTIDHNITYNNCWYTVYGASGITINDFYNYDNNTTTYRNIITNNISYNNRLYVPWNSTCTLSDGNGIIVDIPKTDYNGRQLVANNICYNNGGSGIHALNNKRVDFIHNIAYFNSATYSNGGSAIYAYGCDDVKFFNNILVSRPGKTVNRCAFTTNVTYDYNIYYGGTLIDSLAVVGENSFIQDPLFVNASTDPAVADFHLQPNSPGINNGDNTHSYPTDRDGTARPFGSKPDIGAYEFTGVPVQIGYFTAGTISAVRVGDGTNTLSTNATAANLIEYTAAGTPTGINLTLSNAGSVAPNRMLLSGGNATYEGQLSLSYNGRYLTVAGYEGNVGDAQATYWANDKVVARIGFDAGVDYTTRVPGATLTGTVRSAVTENSSRIYITALNANSSGNSTRFFPFGNLATTSSPFYTNLKSLKIFKAKVYYANGNTIGLLTQTSAGNTFAYTTNLPGVSISGHSYQSFVLLDMDATANYSGTGYDVLYCADLTLGLVKFYWNGTAWVLAGTYNPASATGVTGGLYDITARVNGAGAAEIFVVKGAASNNNIISLTDASGFTGNITTTVPVNTNLVSAGANYMFRGVAFSPSLSQTGTVLPISLLSFSGNLIGNKVVLNWATASEINAKEFVVERSLDGNKFSAIGTLAAKNTTTGNSYQLADENLIAGKMFYRLKAVNKDGSFQYSKTVLINKSLQADEQLKIFPNPATSYFSVSYPVAADKASITIYLVDGRKINTYPVAAGSTQRSMDISDLKRGRYTLVYRNGTQIMTASFVK